MKIFLILLDIHLKDFSTQKCHSRKMSEGPNAILNEDAVLRNHRSRPFAYRSMNCELFLLLTTIWQYEIRKSIFFNSNFCQLISGEIKIDYLLIFQLNFIKFPTKNSVM